MNAAVVRSNVSGCGCFCRKAHANIPDYIMSVFILFTCIKSVQF